MKAVAVIERTREAYEAAFQTARLLEYPEVDAFEQRMGYAIDRQRLDDAARVLACPLKANPPHWAHGRVIYAAARKWINGRTDCGWSRATVLFLDVGTAKGFSALCLRLAQIDSGFNAGSVVSVDVVDPLARVSRNSVADFDGAWSVPDLLTPWRETSSIQFQQSTGVDWLKAHDGRVNVAFIDGKHEGHVVRQEGKLLAARQLAYDIAIFDDCQIPAVSQAVVSLQEFYRFEYVKAEPREYAIGRRR